MSGCHVWCSEQRRAEASRGTTRGVIPREQWRQEQEGTWYGRAAALALVGVLDRVGLHLEADDARAREGVRLVVLDDEAQVVVLVRGWGEGEGAREGGGRGQGVEYDDGGA